MFSGKVVFGNTENGMEKLREALGAAQTVVIGAGAGLSTSAGYTYSGERFQKYFGDFADKYGIKDIYSGGFYPFDSQEEFWGWWSRHIWVNRYMNPPKPVYDQLLALVRDRDYFVITTNVDHCFQRAGFDKQRLFYTQGDYGLFQCSKPCHQATYDNAETVRQMLEAQGFGIAQDNDLIPPTHGRLEMRVPTRLIPHCPRCGRPMTVNLRSDNTFVEDEGWHRHSAAYSDFLSAHKPSKTVFMDLGIGANTPIIIKIPFMRMTDEWPDATYVCLNYGEAFTPIELKDKSICIDGDIGDALAKLLPSKGIQA